MKRLIFIFSLLFVSFQGIAQKKSKLIIWKYTILTEVINSETEVDILFSGKINEGWKLYGTGFNCKADFPKQTGIYFSENGSFAVVKQPVAINQGPLAGSEINCFEQKAEFKATIRILEPTADICGKIRGQLFNTKGELVEFEQNFNFY